MTNKTRIGSCFVFKIKRPPEQNILEGKASDPLFLLFFLQLLFVLFACTCLQTQVQSLPYKSQEAEEQSFTKDQNESIQEMPNKAMVQARGKREVIYNLTELCPGENYKPSRRPPSNGCVERWYYCAGYEEAVCKVQSFGCYNSNSRCAAIAVFRNIGNIKVKITKGCKCA